MDLMVRYTHELNISFVVVGNGFFTLKHQFVNLRDELMHIYSEYDSFATFRIVFDEIDRFN